MLEVNNIRVRGKQREVLNLRNVYIILKRYEAYKNFN